MFGASVEPVAEDVAIAFLQCLNKSLHRLINLYRTHSPVLVDWE